MLLENYMVSISQFSIFCFKGVWFHIKREDILSTFSLGSKTLKLEGAYDPLQFCVPLSFNDVSLVQFKHGLDIYDNIPATQSRCLAVVGTPRVPLYQLQPENTDILAYHLSSIMKVLPAPTLEGIDIHPYVQEKVDMRPFFSLTVKKFRIFHSYSQIKYTFCSFWMSNYHI